MAYSDCVSVRTRPVDHRRLPVRNILIFVLGVIFSCIITAAEKCGVDWGD